jgi:tRNA(fMet)-specific endonuclease VapC
VAEYNENASIEYGKIKTNLEKTGNIIDSNDVFITVHAKSLNAILITNNER